MNLQTTMLTHLNYNMIFINKFLETLKGKSRKTVEALPLEKVKKFFI